jgi:hypothetical protein
LGKHKFYLLAGKRLSSKRVVPQEEAASIAPPASALPIKAAPPTIMGAIFASGAVEKESSDIDSETIL